MCGVNLALISKLSKLHLTTPITTQTTSRQLASRVGGGWQALACMIYAGCDRCADRLCGMQMQVSGMLYMSTIRACGKGCLPRALDIMHAVALAGGHKPWTLQAVRSPGHLQAVRRPGHLQAVRRLRPLVRHRNKLRWRANCSLPTHPPKKETQRNCQPPSLTKQNCD